MKKILISLIVLVCVLSQSFVVAENGFVKDYVGSPYGEVYKNSFGECWRSRYDESTEKLEECGYEKIKDEPVIVEQELVLAPSAASLTTSVAEEITIHAALLFDFDSANLSDDAKVVLDERISKYKGRGELTSNVHVIGYTDSLGPEAYNKKLSEKRASAVARYLEQNTDITDDEIDTVGKGESEAAASNNSREGRALNRRVIIILEGKVIQ